LYINNSSTLIPYIDAILIGESPSSTMYVCSTPTDPGGNVVFDCGAVVMTGGIVAKSVGAIGTTVVAVPPTSLPQAVSTRTINGAVTTPRAIVVMRGPSFIAPSA
jgi:hypothetical protein